MAYINKMTLSSYRVPNLVCDMQENQNTRKTSLGYKHGFPIVSDQVRAHMHDASCL